MFPGLRGDHTPAAEAGSLTRGPVVDSLALLSYINSYETPFR